MTETTKKEYAKMFKAKREEARREVYMGDPKNFS